MRESEVNRHVSREFIGALLMEWMRRETKPESEQRYPSLPGKLIRNLSPLLRP